jgi:hypothetical protein
VGERGLAGNDAGDSKKDGDKSGGTHGRKATPG